MSVGILRWVRPMAWAAAPIFFLTLCARQSPAAGLTPDSPEVQTAIRKAVKFLESDAANDGRLGARALVGLVLLKNGANHEHPKIAQAVAAIQGAVGNRDAAQLNNIDIYSTGLSIIFLSTLNASKYRDEIERLLASLRVRQKPHGGWGYPERETGDTSMTQYGVLSMWEAAQAGCTVPRESIEAVTIWLLKTQDPSGAFGYQGTVSPTFTPVKQREMRHSMAAAGLGSVYICSDLLGFVPRAEKRDDDLPPALKEVKPKQPDEPEAERPKTQVDPRVVRGVESRGNAWMRANSDIPKSWAHYYLYALERYHSFRELTAGKFEKEPKWYSDGARYLVRTQSLDGSWVGQCKATADTAFATLFLLRSTKKSIERTWTFGEGTLQVGRGLPQYTDQIAVRRGSVVSVPRWKSAKEVRAALSTAQGSEYDQAVAALAELPPPEAELLAAQDAALLRRLTVDRLPQVRIAAVRALGNARNLDHVPALIAALDDPDPAVVREAHDALRRVSRRWSVPDLPKEPNDVQRRAVVEDWKKWYLAVRPEAEL